MLYTFMHVHCRCYTMKVAVCLDDRYPALNCIVVTPEEEKLASEALDREMQNTRPRRDVFLPLMKTTFALRRHYILHDGSSVQDIVCEYPALKEASSVSTCRTLYMIAEWFSVRLMMVH